MKYKTQGTCSQEIEIELKDGVIDSVNFTGGCNGNLKGIGALVKGMPDVRASNAVSSLLPAPTSWQEHWNPLFRMKNKLLRRHKTRYV